ncbi:hypothetical protein Nepgr_022159 [Nepenthes gracilis]|uniref:Uncharacterized protein n=1 Tax=Nepenthes gracilis TaxID=150966 RepID=A0AAD3SZW0_NEPGR|nr:hypothetical protein Nepgr_022159 [Nepenthes gracilis]
MELEQYKVVVHCGMDLSTQADHFHGSVAAPEVGESQNQQLGCDKEMAVGIADNKGNIELQSLVYVFLDFPVFCNSCLNLLTEFLSRSCKRSRSKWPVHKENPEMGSLSF